jgi:acetyl-CoA carboxylase biotin carboxylase subunit
MFRKVLIANRGEIAMRLIRALRELGIRSVAVHSTADENSLHVKFADESVCIGPPPATQSYLKIPALISAAEITGADAIHPGYGFLSENAEFAEVCRRSGLTFIGPPPEVIRLMGDKVQARETMGSAGVPILPGTGVLRSVEDAERAVDEIGLPVILKASAGGGGRGMKIVKNREDLARLYNTARTEAEKAFANGDVYLERYVEQPRHIEVQVVGDQHGRVMHLGERECSIQRRHQKLVEESPSPALSEAQRNEIGGVGARAAAALGYSSLGTLEFLMDQQGRFYFMEMNTRIQVEHTVTEMVTGLDLARMQVMIAMGEHIPLGTDQIRPRGHSIEVRVNAEDPDTFTPSPGLITSLHIPGGLGIRVDTAIYAHYKVPPHYDSLLAKLIVHAEHRDAAVMRLRGALEEFVVEGIKTNLPFFKRVVNHPDFVAGRLDTQFLERMSAAA